MIGGSSCVCSTPPQVVTRGLPAYSLSAGQATMFGFFPTSIWGKMGVRQSYQVYIINSPWNWHLTLITTRLHQPKVFGSQCMWHILLSCGFTYWPKCMCSGFDKIKASQLHMGRVTISVWKNENDVYIFLRPNTTNQWLVSSIITYYSINICI